MNWKEELKEYERNKEWDKAIDLMNKSIASNSNDMWLYIHSIYLFHNILLEEDYPEEKQERLVGLLKKYFEESRSKFSEEPEYLFFIGKILHIAEWYFGLEDNSLAFSFQEKAMKMKSNNLLYEWAYSLSFTGNESADYLAHRLISNEESTIDWLKSKGFPGAYVLEHLQMSNERYIKRE